MLEGITVVLFDMDGVLVNVSRSYRRAIDETVLHFTGARAPSRLVQQYKNAGGFNDDWVLTHAIVSEMGVEASLPEIIEVFQAHYRGEQWDGFISDEAPLISPSTLEELRRRGILMGVVTGRPVSEAEWTISRMGWSEFFATLVAKEHYGSRGKPDPFPLHLALDLLRNAGHVIGSGASLYIGDSVDDMVAARAAGLHAVGSVPPYLDLYQHSEHLRSKGAHLVVDSPNRLPELLT